MSGNDDKADSHNHLKPFYALQCIAVRFSEWLQVV